MRYYKIRDDQASQQLESVIKSEISTKGKHKLKYIG